MTQCAPGSRKIILAVACYAMAAFNSVALLGALTGPIAFGMTAGEPGVLAESGPKFLTAEQQS